MSAAFDTHATVKELIRAGMPEAQAEALVGALRQLGHSQTAQLSAELAAMRDNMATKADLAAMRENMATKADLAAMRENMATKADLAAMRENMATKTDLAALEAKLERRLNTLILPIYGVLVAVLLAIIFA